MCICIEFQNQVVKMLVTMEARQNENTKYLHTLMLQMRDIKALIQNLPQDKMTTEMCTNSTLASEIFTTKFPLSNEEDMKFCRDVMNESLTSKLVSTYKL